MAAATLATNLAAANLFRPPSQLRANLPRERQPPWKLVFRPPSRLTVTAPPSSSIRAATAAPP
ncbi:hypothetical protein DEO72_LG11g1752 [Vigna unguiculata]|uniref:Uncharacterized protein n=1 Tax=Vigna unguiculata TaxID=3917 RepID=A0A4D6NSK3_VIGUN|nr:hypothetical protein DEO72_LG11g1752 [Vigna unguiculata]